jgi:signal transduction histidine kinase/ActR/RegA family two-component response regulator
LLAGGTPADATETAFRGVVAAHPTFPKGFSALSEVVTTPEGLLVAAGRDGIVVQHGLDWATIPAPAGKEIGAVAADGGDVLVGGFAFYGRKSADGGWDLHAISDTIGVIERLPEGWFLSGVASGYFWRGDHSEAIKVLPLTVKYHHLIRYRGAAYVSIYNHGVLKWNGKTFVHSTDFPHVGDLPFTFDFAGEKYALTRQHLFRIGGQEPEIGLQGRASYWNGFFLSESYVVIPSAVAGLQVWSRKKGGEPLWVMPSESIGGVVSGATAATTGYWMLLGTGLSHLADLEGFQRSELHAGEVQALNPSPHGPVLSAEGGIFDLESGRRLSSVHFGYASIKGVDSFMGGGELEYAGRRLPVDHGVCYGFWPTEDGGVAADDRGLVRFDLAGGLVKRVGSLAFNRKSAARAKDGSFVVLSSGAALRYSPELELVGQVQPGVREIHQVGDEAWLLGEDGAIRDDHGKLIARLPAKARLCGLTERAGLPLGLIQFQNGQVAAGYLTPSWRPLRTFGLTEAFAGAAILDWGGALYVAGPNGALKISKLTLNELPPWRMNLNGTESAPDRWRLAGRAADLELRLSHDLLPGEHWPEIAFRLNDGDFIPVPVNGCLNVPRLPYGWSELEIARNLDGLEDRKKIGIYRAYPEWFSWWAVSGYGVGVVGGLWSLYRWRTGVLRARARELERRVEERTAELVQAKQAREYFISATSHEIRNPLNGVVGLAEMLHESASTVRERSLATTLRGCADQLRSLLDDVLDWSKIERGEMAIASAPFEVAPAIEAACRSMDVTLARVTWTAPEACWLSGDVAKIRQIVINLVANGLKHGMPPVVTVAAETSAVEGAGRLVVRVRNPGPTLTPDEMEQLFAEYNRGAEAQRRKTPGLGLGLHISRRLATAMGGALTGRSADGQIEFTLTLPLPLAGAVEDEQTQNSPEARVRVLAIEDEAYNRLVQGHHLSQLGCVVDWAEDERGVRECVRRHRYNLVLTDYALNATTGVAIARLLKSELGENCPPIVAVTAYATEEKREEGARAGIREFVTKPVNRAKLAEVLTRYVPEAGLLATSDAEVAREGEAGEFEFSALAFAGDSGPVLRGFADAVEGAWRSLASGTGEARMVHALRSQVLLARAADLAEQLELLEAAVSRADAAAAERIIRVASPMVERLAVAARREAAVASPKSAPPRAQMSSASAPLRSERRASS